jgi:flagellar motor switch protein FliN/FliY
MDELTDLSQMRDGDPAPGDELARLHDVPVELAVEIGRTRMTIRETLALAPGSIVSLNRLAGEPVDLLVNGKPLARGEVVVIDEEFGLRITEIVSATAPRAEREAATAEPPHGDALDADAHGDEAVFASFDEPA